MTLLKFEVGGVLYSKAHCGAGKVSAKNIILLGRRLAVVMQTNMFKLIIPDMILASAK